MCIITNQQVGKCSSVPFEHFIVAHLAERNMVFCLRRSSIINIPSFTSVLVCDLDSLSEEFYFSLNKSKVNERLCSSPCRSLCSSEPSLGRSHELQNQHAGTVPDPLLCARSDGTPEQRVCGPVHPALHQPNERWAMLAQRSEGGDWKSHQVIHYIRWQCVIVLSVPTLSAFLKVVSAPSHLYSTQAFGSYICISFLSSHRLPLGTPLVTRRMQPRSSLTLCLCLVFLKTALCLRHAYTHKPFHEEHKRGGCRWTETKHINKSKQNILRYKYQIYCQKIDAPFFCRLLTLLQRKSPEGSSGAEYTQLSSEEISDAWYWFPFTELTIDASGIIVVGLNKHKMNYLFQNKRGHSPIKADWSRDPLTLHVEQRGAASEPAGSNINSIHSGIHYWSKFSAARSISKLCLH